mgnify:CR=1 FL=1
MINLKTKDWTIKNIDTVIFDKDGTLIDLHYFWGKMTELRAENTINFFNLNPDIKENLCLFLGYDTKNQKMIPTGITAMYSRVKIIELYKEELKKFNITTTKETIEELFDKTSENFYLNIENYIKPIKEAIDFAKKLKEKNIKLAIVTADSITSTNKALKYLNIDDLFDIVIARESHPETKESGKPTQLALRKLSSNPDNTIMIGDSPTDHESAINALIKKTILTASGQMTKQNLQQYSKYCIDSLDEVCIID